jgi:hypothetical protein
MAFESQAISYILINLRNCLNKTFNFGPFGRNFIAIFLFESLSLNTVWSVYIFEIVSSNLYLLGPFRLLVLSRSGPTVS